MFKRLIRKSENDDKDVEQKAPEGYKDLEDFLENATDEELEEYMGDSIEISPIDNFRDEKYW